MIYLNTSLISGKKLSTDHEQPLLASSEENTHTQDKLYQYAVHNVWLTVWVYRHIAMCLYLWYSEKQQLLEQIEKLKQKQEQQLR